MEATLQLSVNDDVRVRCSLEEVGVGPGGGGVGPGGGGDGSGWGFGRVGWQQSKGSTVSEQKWCMFLVDVIIFWRRCTSSKQ